jgi:hypothetical protein
MVTTAEDSQQGTTAKNGHSQTKRRAEESIDLQPGIPLKNAMVPGNQG